MYSNTNVFISDVGFFDDQYQYDSSDDTRSDSDFEVVIDHPNEESDLSEEEESDEAVVDDPGIVSDEAAVDDSRIVVTNSQHGRNL